MLIMSTQAVYAKEYVNDSDTVKHKEAGPKENNAFVKLHSRTAYGIVNSKSALFNFKSMLGTGADFTVGFKLNSSFALGVGLMRMHYFIGQKKIDQALTETYTSPWLPAIVTARKNSMLIQNSLFAYVSRWKQMPGGLLEYHGRLCLASSQYKLNSEVYRPYSDSAHSFNISYEDGISNTAFVMGFGATYSIPVSKIIFLSVGLEYNINLTPRTSLYEHKAYGNGNSATHSIELPTPNHIFQFQVGLMYRPKKPCNCKSPGL